MTRILLAGATGMVGAAALKLLLADDRVTQVVAPTRRAVVPHAKLLNPIMDSADMPRDAGWWTVDGGICALGTTRAKSRSPAVYREIDYDFALAVAARVREAGTTRFALVTSMGADPRSWFRYTRIKGELELAVERLAFSSLTIIRPGFLDGDRNEHRPMESQLGAFLRGVAPILPAGLRVSPARTVAALLVEAVLAGRPGRQVIGSAEIARAA